MLYTQLTAIMFSGRRALGRSETYSVILREVLVKLIQPCVARRKERKEFS